MIILLALLYGLVRAALLVGGYKIPGVVAFRNAMAAYEVLPLIDKEFLIAVICFLI